MVGLDSRIPPAHPHYHGVVVGEVGPRRIPVLVAGLQDNNKGWVGIPRSGGGRK